MKIKQILLFSTLLILFWACSNPYKGFKGVNPKGMKNNKLPSTELREGHKKSEKKMKRKYRREMKKRQKEMGNPVK